MLIFSAIKNFLMKETPYDITYMWSLNYSTNEHIYETETDSQT